MSSPRLPRSARPGPATPGRDGGGATRTAPVPGGTVARYRYDRRTGAWWWSPDMHGLLGLDVSVAPCTEALLAAHHPDDGARVLAAITACGAGRAFAMETRVLHPPGRQRWLVLLGEPAGDDGEVRAVEGLAADVTGGRPAGPDDIESLRVEIAQLHTAMASRAVIEQAKGALMLLTGCTAQAAFDLLSHISSHTHRKVREVAEEITGSATGHGALPADVRAILRDACPPARPLP